MPSEPTETRAVSNQSSSCLIATSGPSASCSAVVSAGSVIGRSAGDRKSTRLNSSHSQISYAVFCLKKKIIYLECDVDVNIMCLDIRQRVTVYSCLERLPPFCHRLKDAAGRRSINKSVSSQKESDGD